MNISLLNNDTVSSIVKMEIEKNDYAETYDKNLRQYRQQANIPGFRKGMAPLGLIKKMVGKTVLVDELNKLIVENLNKYLKDNDIRIIGEPMPNETERVDMDLDVQENFTFYFDIAFAPVIPLKFTKRDKLDRYEIIIDDEMVDDQIESYKKSYGTYDKVETVTPEDMVKGIVTELADGQPKEGGIVLEEAILMPSYIKGKREQAKFLKAKLYDKVVFNPQKAYKNEPVEIASFLKIDKEAAKAITSDFQFEINEITHYQEPEMNKEFFQAVVGKDSIETIEDFREQIRASIKDTYVQQSDYLFIKDARALILKKAGKVEFADALLKRMFLSTSSESTPEKIEADYPSMTEELIYLYSREKFIADNEIKVDDKDLEEYARKVTKSQFAQYGMMTMSDELLDRYTKNMLQNKEMLDKLINGALDDKFFGLISEKVKMETKEVTREEFEKLFT
ncbi:MAG: trigger factor [Tannerella sp.]|jgi:trigger factor|nr:trigger factor [Tannerella sp.]